MVKGMKEYIRKKYTILEISESGHLYTLEDEVGKKFEIVLYVWDVEPPPQVGDYIWFSDVLLDTKIQGGWEHFTFGNLSEISGRNINTEDLDTSDEIFVIERNNEKIYLKRLYG